MDVVPDSECGNPRRDALDRPGEAFHEAYRLYSPAVYSYFVSHSSALDQGEIPRLVQEVFARHWEQRSNFRGESSLKTYLLGIAKNVLREEQRARRRWATVPFDDVEHEVVADVGGVGDAIEAMELTAVIERATGRLTPEQREAYVLVHVLRLPLLEAAEAADCNPNQFRNRLCRARKVLRRLLRGLLPCIAIGMVWLR